MAGIEHSFDLSDGRCEVHGVRFHRNGIGGEGFHVVTFTYLASDGSADALLGVVFREDGHVAVLDPTDADRRWRGDNFEDGLRRAVELYDDYLATVGRG